MTRVTAASPGHLLVDREITALLGGAIRASAGAARPSPSQVSPSSIDLRLGPRAWRIRAGFLPGGTPLEDRLRELAISEVSLEGEGAVLERGLAYLVRSRRSSSSRPICAVASIRAARPDAATSSRASCARATRASTRRRSATADACGSRSRRCRFPVRLKRGDRLRSCACRADTAALSSASCAPVRAHPAVLRRARRARARASTRCRSTRRAASPCASASPGRDPAGWRAARTRTWSSSRAMGRTIRTTSGSRCTRTTATASSRPGSFYVFASRERLRIPPELAAEMLPVDVGIGELRNNYAGFFDNGFGWRERAGASAHASGTPAVLEVRAHDVPVPRRGRTSVLSLALLPHDRPARPPLRRRTRRSPTATRT